MIIWFSSQAGKLAGEQKKKRIQNTGNKNYLHNPCAFQAFICVYFDT